MNPSIYLLIIIVIVLFIKINALPRYRYRRQINPIEGIDQRMQRQNNPSGSIVGTYYYGIGSDPNYGSFIRPPNTAGGSGILPISYDPNSNLYNNLINPSYQQQNYMYNNNNNNAWQRPNTNNNYYNQQSNRYAPGSPGWYATGGNYRYNNGQSIIAYPCLLIINILILMICK